MTNQFKVDILAFGPHPDDIEFGCGGLLAKAAKLGKNTAIVDMSLAELSTNGDVKTRLIEADKARETLGASVRENLEIPNNFFFNSKEIQDKVIRKIRKYQPEMVLAPYYFDRHPDHEDTSEILRQALFTTGLVKYVTGQQHYRPKYVFFYMMWYEFQPSVIVDISDVWETKKSALSAYNSQFSAGKGQRYTIDNDDRTMKFFESRARNYGFSIGKEFGEPYLSINPLGITDPFTIIPNFF